MKVLIAMSGGVDSSVAAYLLKQQGYECIGCTMKLFTNGDPVKIPDGQSADPACPEADGTKDARAVAERMGIPFYVFDFTDRFRETVMQDFADNYIAARTPNPCIVCNRCLKFGALYDRAKELGCDFIATGHYARIGRENGRYVLKKGSEPEKDQSYVLYNLTQEQLAHVLFPLGELSKSEVRRLAAEQGLVNAEKPESQDICFVPGGDYAGFIHRFCNAEFPEGDVTDTSGRLMGRHRGLIHYTVGQRKGLGIAAEVPMYVRRLNAEKNTVVLARAEEMFDTALTASGFSWVSGKAPDRPVRCKARVRYHHPEQDATVTACPDGTVHVCFDRPVRAITPGQSVVLYDGDSVLGGGVINSSYERNGAKC